MEENKVIEMEDEEVTEVKKESKIKTALGKVGSGIKKHWKTVAVGAGALAVGMFIGSKRSEIEDYETEDDSDDIELTEIQEDTQE